MNGNLNIRLHDLEYEKTGLSIDMSYCCQASTVSVKLNTPFGVIDACPKTGFNCDLYIIYINDMISAIKSGFKKKSQIIWARPVDDLFCIKIDAGLNGEGYKKDLFLFTMELDVVGLLDPGTSAGDIIRFSFFQNKKNIEELVKFFRDVKKAKKPNEYNF